LSEIALNFARFWPQLIGGGPCKFWDPDYKIQHTFDHMAKFAGDRSRELGDLAVRKRKETSAVKQKACY